MRIHKAIIYLFNLVTDAIFLDVSQDFDDIPQEDEALLWDVERSEKLLDGEWRLLEGKGAVCGEMDLGHLSRT